MGGILFVLSGPSGSGKSTILAIVKKTVSGLGYSVSHTTRKPRASEADGKDYHFVSRKVFDRMEREGAFVEYAEVYGHLYGTSRASVDPLLAGDLDVVLDVDHQGAFNIRKKYPDSRLIYVLPPSLETLRQRLSSRGSDSPEAVEGRLSKAMAEISRCFFYDYIVINKDLDEAVADVAGIIRAERCRAAGREPFVRGLYPGLGSPAGESNEGS
jgi:guanylate kinase